MVFESSFRFTEKLSRRYAEFPHSFSHHHPLTLRLQEHQPQGPCPLPSLDNFSSIHLIVPAPFPLQLQFHPPHSPPSLPSTASVASASPTRPTHLLKLMNPQWHKIIVHIPEFPLAAFLLYNSLSWEPKYDMNLPFQPDTATSWS